MTRNGARLIPGDVRRAAKSQAVLVAATVLAAYGLGRMIPGLGIAALAPIICVPFVVVAFYRPALLVWFFPFAVLALSSDWRFQGISALEVVGFSMVGVAGMQLMTKRSVWPRSSLPLVLAALIGLFAVYAIAVPDDSQTMSWLTANINGLALYLAVTIIVRNARDAMGVLPWLSAGCLMLLGRFLLALVFLPGYTPETVRSYESIIAVFTTWQVNEALPLLLVGALLLEDRRIRRFLAAGFAAGAIVDVVSLSKAGVIELVLVLALTGAVLGRRMGVRGVVVVLLALTPVFIYQRAAQIDVADRIVTTLEREVESQSTRLHILRNGFAVFAKHPLTGVVGTADAHSLARYHSYWGGIAGGYGLPVLLLSVIMMWLVVRDAGRLVRLGGNGTLGVLGRGLLISAILACVQMLWNGVLYQKAYAMIFWFLRGLTTACLGMLRARTTEGGHGLRPEGPGPSAQMPSAGSGGGS